MIRYFILALLIAGLSGCTALFGLDNVFRDRRSDYLRASEMTPISVPADLDSETLGTAYPVPSAGQVSAYQLDSAFATPRPEKIGVESGGEVRIQRLGEDQWVLVPAPPGEVWPQLRNFLATSDLPTLATDAALGLIETAPVPDADNANLMHQYRFQLEQGVQLNTTEIIVQHRQLEPAAPAVQSDWDGAEAKAEAMRLALAEALAASEGSGTASLLGQRIGAVSKIDMVTPSAADPFMLMKLSYERSWASVEYALGRNIFSIREQNEDEGRFDILLRETATQERSWLGRLLRSAPETGSPYRIELRRGEEGIEVRVTRPDGSSLPQREAFNILTLLRSNLA